MAATKAAPKIAAKAILDLVKNLQAEHRASEMLAPFVDGLKEARGLALAEAALKKAKKGLRSTYLAARVAEAKGDAKTAAKLANEFCKGFGALDRGRLNLAHAFCLVAPLANDVASIHAAVKAMAFADAYHHSFLPVAMANAEARGDAAEAATWRERLAISERLRPVILELRRNQEEQTLKKATAAVDAMTDDDRRFVFRRLVSRPEMFDPDLLARAIAETTADAEVPAAAWVRALGQLGDDDEDTAVAKALRARVNAEPATMAKVVERILEVDKSAGHLAKDEDPDDHPIYKGVCTALFALAERAGDPKVFAIFDYALRETRAVVQHALIVTWLHGNHAGKKAWPSMSDAQARECFSFLIASARKGPHSGAAEHSIYYWSRKGVEDLVEEGLEKETKHEEVIDNLYSVVGYLGARTIAVRMIPREKQAFWRLQDAIGTLWTPEWHQELLAQLDTWGEPRLAEIYLEALSDHVKKLAPTIELVRRVLAWPTPTGAQAGYLKRILVEGTRYALDAREYDLAREAWKKAEAIKTKALSNEHITERKNKTVPDPFADKDAKAKLKKLLSGELEKAEAAERKKVEAARAAGKPKKATDATLAALANADVKLRVFDHPVTRETLFLDPEDGYRYYDGYGVMPVPWSIAPLTSLPTALENETRCDERALAFDKAGQNYREVVRWGRTVMVLWGINNRYGITGGVVGFAETSSAHAFYEKVRAAAPEGMTYGSAYHLAGKGGIQRIFTRDLPEGVEDEDEDEDEKRSTRIAVLGSRWTEFNQRFGSPEEAERAYDEWELDHYKRGNRLHNLEWHKRLQRDEDMLLHEWLDERARDDSETIGWHIEALTEFERVLRAQSLWPKDASVVVEPAATDEAIAAFAAGVEVLPEALRDAWKVTAGASWKLGAKQQRLLGPEETIAHRPKMQAWVDSDKRLEPTFRTCEGIAFNQDNAPVIAARCTKNAGKHQFLNIEPGAKSQDTYSTDHLRWHFCTTMTRDLIHELTRTEPLIYALKFGEAAPKRTKSVTLKSGEKVWTAVLDADAGTFFTVLGTRAARKKLKDGAAATKAFDAAVKAQRAKGFK